MAIGIDQDIAGPPQRVTDQLANLAALDKTTAAKTTAPVAEKLAQNSSAQDEVNSSGDPIPTTTARAVPEDDRVAGSGAGATSGQSLGSAVADTFGQVVGKVIDASRALRNHPDAKTVNIPAILASLSPTDKLDMAVHNMTNPVGSSGHLDEENPQDAYKLMKYRQRADNKYTGDLGKTRGLEAEEEEEEKPTTATPHPASHTSSAPAVSGGGAGAPPPITHNSGGGTSPTAKSKAPAPASGPVPGWENALLPNLGAGQQKQASGLQGQEKETGPHSPQGLPPELAARRKKALGELRQMDERENGGDPDTATWQGMKDAGGEMLQGVKNLPGNLYEGVKQGITHPIDTTISGVTNTLRAGKNLWHSDPITEGINGITDPTLSQSERSYNLGHGAAILGASELGGRALGAVGKGAKALVRGAADLTPAAVGEGVAKLHNIGDIDVGAAAKGAVKSGIARSKQVASDVADKAGQVKDVVVNKAKQTGQAINNKVQGAKQAVSGAVKQGSEAYSNARSAPAPKPPAPSNKYTTPPETPDADWGLPSPDTAEKLTDQYWSQAKKNTPFVPKSRTAPPASPPPSSPSTPPAPPAEKPWPNPRAHEAQISRNGRASKPPGYSPELWPIPSP